MPFLVMDMWTVDTTIVRVRICKFVTHSAVNKLICQRQTNNNYLMVTFSSNATIPLLTFWSNLVMLKDSLSLPVNWRLKRNSVIFKINSNLIQLIPSNFFFSCIIMISADGWIIFCYVGWCESLSRLVGQNNWFLIFNRHMNEISSFWTEDGKWSLQLYHTSWAVEYERAEKFGSEWDLNQINNWLLIWWCISTIYLLIIDPHNDQLPVGEMTQLVEHCMCITELMVWVLFRAEFFRPLIH